LTQNNTFDKSMSPSILPKLFSEVYSYYSESRTQAVFIYCYCKEKFFEMTICFFAERNQLLSI